MSEVGLRAPGRRGLVRALLAGVLLAGLVGGWAAGALVSPSAPNGHVLATEGTIIVEN